MAIALVGKGLTGSTVATTLAISPTATAGDTLYAFVSETAAVTAPTVTDNLGGTWTVEATSGETATATASIWFAWKKAAGGETEIKVTPGAGATGQGLLYFEASGAANEAPEHLLVTNKQASALTHASPEITAASGDLILIGAAWGGGNAEAESWNNAMTNFGTANARLAGGYLITTEALAAKVFTLTLKVAKAGGLLAVALKPSAAGEHAERAVADTITVSESITTRTAAHPRATADTVSVSEAVERTATHPRAAADTVAVSESVARTAADPRTAADTVAVSEVVTRTTAHPRSTADTVIVSESITSVVSKLRTVGDTVTITESVTRSAQALARTAADTVTVAEAVVRLVAHPRAATDTITVAESLTSGVSRPRSVGDAVTVAEGASRAAQTLSRTADDTIVVSMTVTGVVHGEEVAPIVLATPLPGWVAVGQRGRIATRRGHLATRNVGRAEI